MLSGRVRVRVRIMVRVGAWMSQCREQSQVSRFTPRGGSSSTYPYIHITINTLQVELKNAWGATDLVIMKCVCSSAGITNTCHTTEESQAIVVTPPKVHLDSLGCITVSEWGGP